MVITQKCDRVRITELEFPGFGGYSIGESESARVS